VGERPHEATSDGTNHTETVWELARVIVSLQWSRQRHYPSRTEVLQPDDDRKAIQLLHGHLVAKSIKGDEAGDRVLETDLVGFGDAEVWCDEAVLSPSTTQTSPQRCAYWRLSRKGVPVSAAAAEVGSRRGSPSQILRRPDGTTTSALQTPATAAGKISR
jgi:hypothetical protein